jgi:hypothetical protein
MRAPIRAIHAGEIRIPLRSRCPPEFKVDEIPDPIKIETAYGAYMAEWKVKGNQLSFQTIAPSEGYDCSGVGVQADSRVF